MKEAAFRAEQLKAQHAAQTSEIDSNAVITGLRRSDGSYHVLSRYGDAIWTLPDSMFAAGVKDSEKILNFNRVPLDFRDTMRVCFARYILIGIEGRNRPKGIHVFNFFYSATLFLTWLQDQRIDRLSDVTLLTSQQYVESCKGLSGRKYKSLSAGALSNRLRALESLHILSRQSADPMRHPWPESSALHLAGLTGGSKRGLQEAKTAIIPDEILASLFASAVEWLDRHDEIINPFNQVEEWKVQGRSTDSIRARLAKLGWTQDELRIAARHLQSACICIILITSGIRVSELLSLTRKAAHTTLDDQGEPFYWMRGISYKTGEGVCEWLAAKITHRAIAIAERLALPLHARLAESIARLRADNPKAVDIVRLSEHADRLFLGITKFKYNRIDTLSSQGVLRRLNEFAGVCGVDWRFTPHQFRRTFAVYAAHSAFGDLRYLRDHFKHWSLDMTTLYAMDRDQDAELYDEIGVAALGVKTDLIEHWLEPDAIIAGGAADPIQTFRAKDEALATKSDRAAMAKKISPLVNLRATGVAWCTADTGGCNGGQGVEKTRCGDCGNAVIDESRKPIWQAIYTQQIELRNLTDIGPGGAERIKRDIERCKKVLKELGATEEDLADVTA